MIKSKTVIDKIVILCRNLEKTSSLYCQTLGLKINLQSPELVQLQDANNNIKIYLKQTKIPFHLTKGYSPILSFRVEDFDKVREKLLRYQLIQDGQVIENQMGKLANFMGSEGQHISINNYPQEQEQQDENDKQDQDKQQKSIKQIRNILSKIKL